MAITCSLFWNESGVKTLAEPPHLRIMDIAAGSYPSARQKVSMISRGPSVGLSTAAPAASPNRMQLARSS